MRIKKVKQFLASTNKQKIHLVFVFVMAWIIRIVILCVPFKFYRGLLGRHQKIADYCPIATTEQIILAQRCGQFIERVCNKLPWQAKCLVQAIILGFYARYYRFPYLLHLGMAKQKDEAKVLSEPMMAHAWTRVGPLVVTGGGDLSGFAIVASFSYCPD